jgi:inorganic pyrophosphatase
VVRARPIGVLLMQDEGGQDEKIICVPHDKMHTLYSNVDSTDALPAIVRDQIEHFFTRYKDLEPGKWVKITGWGDKAQALSMISSAMEAAKK